MPQYSDDLFLGGAQTFMGTGLRAYSTTAIGGTGSTSSTTLTITSVGFGSPIVVGMYVDGTGVTDGTYITAFVSGNGGAGTYTLNQAINIANTVALTLHGNVAYGNPAPMDLGVGPLGRIYVWDVVPQAAVTNNIAASQTTTTAGQAVTLTAGTSAKSTTTAGGVSVIQLDVPRAIKVNSSTTARAFTVSGYDYYGQAMTEVITVVTAATAVTGLKAFYQVSGVTISGSATAVVVGTSDVLGIPVRVTNVAYVASVKSNSTLAQDAGTFVAADTATATNATGDVRGTYTPATASNGIVRTVMGILLPGIAVGPNSTRVGALGVTQA
jgi:hypothetical protein